MNKENERSEGVYIRKGSSTIPANEATIKEMLMQTSGRSYESARSIEQECKDFFGSF